MPTYLLEFQGERELVFCSLLIIDWNEAVISSSQTVELLKTLTFCNLIAMTDQEHVGLLCDLLRSQRREL